MPAELLKRIQTSALRLMMPLDSQSLFQTCVKESIRLTGADFGSLFIEKNGTLVRVYTNVPANLRLNPRIGGNTYTSLKTGETRFMSRKMIQKSHPEAGNIFESIITIPLHHQKKKLGVITLSSYTPIIPSPALVQTLKVFGSLVTLAIRNIQLYEESQNSLQTRNLFMSAAAHEIRTPLAVIYTYAQLAQKKYSSSSLESPRWVEVILSNCHRLTVLIQDLFSVSQISMGMFHYSFQSISILKMIEKIVAEGKILYKRDIQLHTTLDPQDTIISADPDKLELVFFNILGNAVKHSSAPSSINISIQKEKFVYCISITDYGSGINKEDLPHVFEQYYQGKQKKNGGMGLGMYLCKEIITAHSGEINIRSKVGKGTQVDILLPFLSHER